MGGPLFSGSRFEIGVNNLLLSKYTWDDTQLAELFAVADEDFASLSFYDQICSWCKLGEDTYPAVQDLKGQLTGGSLIGGQPSDFQHVP